jgi:GxxExxY protein
MITKPRKSEKAKKSGLFFMRGQAFRGDEHRYQFEELSSKIIGAAIQVHRELGPGFLESIYEEALKLELSENGLYCESQKEIVIEYLGVQVGIHRLDLIVQNEVIVELKAVSEFSDTHFAQLRSYLKATGLKVGLLLNFARPTLEIKRIVN